MSKLKWAKRACGIFLLWATAAVALPAQSFITLHSFDAKDGAGPRSALVRATDGNFYGTTFGGGANFDGTVFKITPGGTLTTLHSFDRTDGSGPNAPLIQGADGNFYGTTYQGGASNNCSVFNLGCGTVFKITPRGTLTTLYSFCSQGGSKCTDGLSPFAGLTQGTDGNFYGTTSYGGVPGGGTIFKITPGGALTTIYNFCSLGFPCTDGAGPDAELIQAADGKFYGTTVNGGDNYFACNAGCGTVFKITPGGALTTLHSFCVTDGTYPSAALVQAADGNFYGTTRAGGNAGNHPQGTVFKITSGGTLKTLYSFCARGGAVCADGGGPSAALVQATDGNFYGTTFFGGADDDGTVFKITPSGALTTLHSFDLTHGDEPSAGLVQDTNGNFYGTTSTGGASNFGTVFGVSVGLAPFVETLPTSGKVGAHVKILGTNLTGATSVTFNGAAATFTVLSNHAIITTVPAGATSGTVQVVTPGGTLSSNVPFTVK